MTPRSAPSFTSFTPSSPELGSEGSDATFKVSHYRVERIAAVRGAAAAPIVAGEPLWRLEAAGKLPVPDAPFIGTTGHVVYTDAATRSELARISAAEQPPIAVLIPICKSSDWWSLAQDARQAHLDGRRTRGHVAIGRAHAARVYRRLYHARYLPGSEWDFLTYFEFREEDTGHFQELLARLRDPEENPEWAYVEREVEIWMTRLGAP